MQDLFAVWRSGVLGLVTLLAGVAPLAAAAPNTILPVPVITIYPGDTIKDAYLVDHDFAGDPLAPHGGVIDTRSALVGKLARQTLLAGVPIPLNAISEPNAITNGARVRVVFAQDGLEIDTYAIALQAGSVGEVISVRNPDSGSTISGVIQSDGSVRVGG
ncbi:MAG TPA: flagellar basal body P-ring formation chaperone FlgA [Methylovirgula sp.]|jgi:flagella basal body P-ring formation protein FlgA